MTDEEIREQVHAAAERLIEELGPLAASDLLLSWSQAVTDRVTHTPDSDSARRAAEWLPHRRVA